MIKAEKMDKDAPLKECKMAGVPKVNRAKMKNDDVVTDKMDRKAS